MTIPPRLLLPAMVILKRKSSQFDEVCYDQMSAASNYLICSHYDCQGSHNDYIESRHGHRRWLPWWLHGRCRWPYVQVTVTCTYGHRHRPAVGGYLGSHVTTQVVISCTWVTTPNLIKRLAFCFSVYGTSTTCGNPIIVMNKNGVCSLKVLALVSKRPV